MKYLYKYPQAAYLFGDLVETNRRRCKQDFEYELLDRGVLDQDRYFDVFVEYAKAAPEDILIQITVFNRGSEPAMLHVLPTVWFRNTWSWGEDAVRPILRQVAAADRVSVVAISHSELGERFLYCEGAAALLFTENETNTLRLSGVANRTPYVKDGFNSYVVHGHNDAVNPEKTGTKASAHYPFIVGAKESRILRLPLNNVTPVGSAPTRDGLGDPFGPGFDNVMESRRREADEFYASVIPSSLDADHANVMRQVLAGMLWSKQYYYYDVEKWLEEHGADPFNPMRGAPRNDHWHHMLNADIVSMPDKWEYPWNAAWDLAFHVAALTLMDEDFGKKQLELMVDDSYLHPSGQLPA
jgi:hypothetical protein